MGEGSREGSRQGSRRPSIDSDVPALPSFARTFKRKKTPVPEPTPEIDLNAALPPSDDFRTSLLMPKLCARFSMLKEQDDPDSILGKAKDDSVLFPKRASRLELFNNRPGLSDIAEADSHGVARRPPFATTRTESFNSEGYGTDDGSVMARAKPGEGNTMFGGRQKLYKIPVGAAGSVKYFGNQEEHEVPSGGTMGGKPIYESDTTRSTFQQLRQWEKEEREKATRELSQGRPSREHDGSGSPPYARYNRNRETASSTTSAPSQSRASTAATSVASQKSIYAAHEDIHGGPLNLTQMSNVTSDKHFIKSRRMYGQGMDRETLDHQPSLQRVGSFNRFRTPTSGLAANPLRQSRSATNLGERFQRGAPLYTSNPTRTESPVPSPTPPTMAEFNLGLNDDHPGNNMVDSGYGRSPPVSPPMSPEPDPTLVASLEPNDIGKATASGAFNKPRKQYDEQQYLQRQLQMREERNTPSPQFSRPFSPALSSLNDQSSAGRSRNNSQGSAFSRNNSIRRPWIEDRLPRPGLDGRQSAASRHTHEEHVRPAIERSFFTSNSINSGDASPTPGSEPESDGHDAVHAGSQTSIESGEECKTEQERAIYESLHPGDTFDDAASESRSYLSETTIKPAQDQPAGDLKAAIDADSPTLGPVGVSNGLSGLVRAHLRSDSGQSSIYPEDTPRQSRKNEIRESIFGHGSALSDQAELEEINSAGGGHDMASPPPLSLAARTILEQAKTFRNIDTSKAKQLVGTNKAQRILGNEAPCNSHGSDATHGEQIRSHHIRGASTETQQEREELAQELAERRRIVQGKLQTFVEAESRSASPAPSMRTRDNSPATGSMGFGLLKKSSRGSLIGKEKNSKAMKMLGIENETVNNPPPGLFMMRDQLPDRAMPPRSKSGAPSQRKDIPYAMNESLSIGHPTNKPRRSEDRNARNHSRHSSKSSSAYSGSSEKALGPHAIGLAGAGPVKHKEHIVNGQVETMRSQSANGTSPFDHPILVPSRPSMDTSDRSLPPTSPRLRSNSRPLPVSAAGKRTAPAGTPYMINPSSRPGPPNFSKSAPAFRENQMYNPANQPILTGSRQSPPRPLFRSGQGRKQSINKQDISEPTFISCTSSVDTIDLPPGANLKNGMDEVSPPNSAPPIPIRDSRRKRTITLRQAFGRSEKGDYSPAMLSPAPSTTSPIDPYEERSTFSDDEPASKPKQRLRKFNRDEAINTSKFRHPMGSATSPSSPITDQVPFHARKDMPAGVVMF